MQHPPVPVPDPNTHGPFTFTYQHTERIPGIDRYSFGEPVFRFEIPVSTGDDLEAIRTFVAEQTVKLVKRVGSEYQREIIAARLEARRAQVEAKEWAEEHGAEPARTSHTPAFIAAN